MKLSDKLDFWGVPLIESSHDDKEEASLKSVSELKTIKAKLAAAAQSVYDDWGQDEFGNWWCRSQEGPGGICHLIADEMISVISAHGFEAKELSHDSMVHVSVLVKTAEGIAEVDISPYRYETGGGYNWQKIPDVQFEAEDVSVSIINRDLSCFDDDY